ncbi:MAG: hypothetical protein LBM17_09085 [Candidatus Accumulibacter sp.]|jgi:hypothetical protein|nr:hypothetical protein [Accumulibacter sp.]
MGFDVSFHPINENEIREWYFDAMSDDKKIDVLAREHDIDDFYREKYREVIRSGREIDASEVFDVTHSFRVAVVQGFFRTYFYTRGSAFTFLIEQKPEYKKYLKPWKDILGREPGMRVHDQIIENYCGGVYIPPEQVAPLIEDYEKDETLKAALDGVFSEGNIAVFLKALNFAKDGGFGILEATEVVEPNPLDLNASVSYSNLYHCDTEGPLLYSEIAARQIAEAIEMSKAGQANGESEDKPKKGFFSRLFGK